MPVRMRTLASFAIRAACLIALTGQAAAQMGLANPKRGQELARRLCANCHVVGPETSGSVRADVSSFPTVANRPGVTAEQLAGRIIVPHPAMPGVALTRQELRDIISYILTLKRNN